MQIDKSPWIDGWIFRVRDGSPNGICLAKLKKLKFSLVVRRANTPTGPYIAFNLGWWMLAIAWGKKEEDYKP